MTKDPELYLVETRASEYEYKAVVCDNSIAANSSERVDACSWLLDSDQLPEEGIVNVLYHRGSALADMEEYDRAIADYTAVLDIDPNDHSTLFELAWLYVTSKTVQHRDGAEAIRLATRAVALHDASHTRQALASACAETC